MNAHLLWMWIWFIIGMVSYMLKRAYYGINPPNPVATGYVNYVQRAWVPLLIRGLLESMVFWLAFTPGLADRALTALGWTSYDWLIQIVTTEAPAAAILGHAMDSVADMAISKIPYLNLLPQMPGPLPQTIVPSGQAVPAKP